MPRPRPVRRAHIEIPIPTSVLQRRGVSEPKYGFSFSGARGGGALSALLPPRLLGVPPLPLTVCSKYFILYCIPAPLSLSSFFLYI
jgi:hypothetical protein